MSKYRRFLNFVFLTLVVLSSSVFLFQEPAYAEDLTTMLQSKYQDDRIVPETALQRIQDLENKNITVARQLEIEQQAADDLAKQLAEKKAEAEYEKQRLETIRNMFVHIDQYAFDAAGNRYTPGNCTWYAKSRRPDISNSWGNANTWYYSAKSQGWNVGSTPKKGAVATTTAGWAGHVAYVEGVSLDGLWVTISEMNFGFLYNMNTRTVYYTEFNYIYELN